jgi:hypothetical protein
MASATQDDPLSTLLKKWIPYLPLPESTWLSSVANNMIRKSGIVMATPRSIVDLVTVRLECLEAGVDLGGGPVLAEAGPSKISVRASAPTWSK